MAVAPDMMQRIMQNPNFARLGAQMQQGGAQANDQQRQQMVQMLAQTGPPPPVAAPGGGGMPVGQALQGQAAAMAPPAMPMMGPQTQLEKTMNPSVGALLMSRQGGGY